MQGAQVNYKSEPEALFKSFVIKDYESSHLHLLGPI